uniref:Uncharacterized protein n=1 Tax=Meloidogyne enterolobii TaxID=390850 RepID=A0A6V7VFK5_MELEN|nr:unnamed protein product [Meloidogyne enterolobii]
MNLNSVDKMDELPELVHEFVASKNILYNPDESSRCFCMSKSKNGKNLKIFLENYGRVGAIFESGNIRK